MLIPITFNPSSSLSSTPSETSKLPSALAKISNDEVVLIELQGALEVEAAQSSDKNGKFVGKLTINENGREKPTLLIGHHLLEGKIASLNKPLAILTRSATNVNSSSTIASSTDLLKPELKGRVTPTPRVQWKVMGIVKRKIVFAKRPMPIVGQPS
ncbi:hypothetical protein AN958_12494 [Leucoagaricus sp. SymC.cos]|nr:hypothetical protein AN958_12494 [Leucoagaricus sp. SymC.cos]